MRGESGCSNISEQEMGLREKLGDTPPTYCGTEGVPLRTIVPISRELFRPICMRGGGYFLERWCVYMEMFRTATCEV